MTFARIVLYLDFIVDMFKLVIYFLFFSFVMLYYGKYSIFSILILFFFFFIPSPPLLCFLSSLLLYLYLLLLRHPLPLDSTGVHDLPFVPAPRARINTIQKVRNTKRKKIRKGGEYREGDYRDYRESIERESIEREGTNEQEGSMNHYLILILFNRATANMHQRFPDATAEEIANAHGVCIVCREEMVAAKKLPCSRISSKFLSLFLYLPFSPSPSPSLFFFFFDR